MKAPRRRYRKKAYGDCWHDNDECRSLPWRGDIVEREFVGRPPSGEICNQCLAKAKRGVWAPIKPANGRHR